MTALSPTQRSLKVLRERGYTCAIVEHWNPHRGIRQDLFGFLDILCLRDNETLGVQTTTTGVASRIRKITDSPLLPVVRAAGWGVHVHGWRKNSAGKWVLREEDLS
jgi:hypothetical protein